MDKTGKRDALPGADAREGEEAPVNPDGAELPADDASGADHLPKLNFLDVPKLGFEKPGPDRPVRLTVAGDRSYLRVSARAAFPLTDRATYVEFYDGADKAIGMIRSLDQLSPEAREIVEAEIDRRYFTPVLTRIDRVKREFGFYRWEVATDRGEKDFVVKSIREDIDILGGGRYRIKDVEGRFYEIPDITQLPPASRGILEEML